MTQPEYLPYLETLRRIPDEIILSMATREFDMSNNTQCVCGWAWREAFTRLTCNGDAADVGREQAANRPTYAILCGWYGGEEVEWEALYWAADGKVSDKYDARNPERAAIVEEAFVRRVAECV